MTYMQIIIFVLILIIGVVWLASVLSRPYTVENRDSIKETVVTALATATKLGGSVHVYYTREGLTISYFPEDEDDESVQDGD